MSIDETPRVSVRPIHKRHYNSLPKTSLEPALRTERRELGLSLCCLSQASLVSLIVGARGAERAPSSGGLASTATGIVEWFVDLSSGLYATMTNSVLPGAESSL